MKRVVCLIIGFIALMCCKSFSEETSILNPNSWEAFAFENTLDDSILDQTQGCSGRILCQKYYSSSTSSNGTINCCAKYGITTGYRDA